jgi:hypothetical protein
MNRFKVVQERSDVTHEANTVSFDFWCNVVEYDDDGNEIQQINLTRLSPQVARELAAELTWMVHLDKWMTTVVEDEDVTEEVAEILGLDADLPIESEDSGEIEKAYDRMTAGALKFLPGGLRRLADRYGREWERVQSV